MAELREVKQSRHVNTRRLAAVTAGFCLWVVAVQAKLVYLQVYEHDRWLEAATEQQSDTIQVPARRGDIVDRNGRPLAYSVDAVSISVNPRLLKQSPEATAAAVCAAIESKEPACAREIAPRLSPWRPERDKAGNLRKRHYADLVRQVTPEQAQRVKALGIPGLSFVHEPRRYYPNRELAAHVLGYMGVDAGQAGIEKLRDIDLRGRPGRLTIQRDGRTRWEVFNAVGTPPAPGATLELTIDIQLQHIAERELRRGVAENAAEGGAVVILDPRTGEILALVSDPTFNPNNRSAAETEGRWNRAFHGSYEPGSTFKMVTAAAALDEGTVTPNTLVHTGNGIFRIPGRTKPITDTHAHGTITVSDVIALSSNIGAMKIGETIGTARLESHVKRLGFGTRLSPDADKEDAGVLRFPAVGSRGETSERASISMGYQILVTPLQMASAFAAVANRGLQVQPHLVRAVIEGNRRKTFEPSPNWPRQVMKPETAEALLPPLEKVVSEEGTARLAEVPGFTVAGKTGTSNKYVRGLGYTPTYNASFVGFVPSRRPELVILVLIDSPHGKNGHYGGPVAGPVFSRIAQASLRYLGVKPTENPLTPVVVTQAVSAPRKISGPATALTIMPPAPRTLDGQTPLPDVRGQSGRQALRELVRRGLAARLIGDGLVVEQDPPPGTALPPGSICRLTLARTPRAGAAGIQP